MRIYTLTDRIGGVLIIKNFKEKLKAIWGKFYVVLKKIGHVLRQIGIWIFRLRKIFMAIPVIWFAVKFARENAQRLPDMVGINLQSTGEFSQMISRTTAVNVPLMITGACLLLMFCSRKTLFPWLISIFTLVLPHLIYFSNIYPA